MYIYMRKYAATRYIYIYIYIYMFFMELDDGKFYRKTIFDGKNHGFL